MASLKQSTTYARSFLLVGTTDHIAPILSVTATYVISKAGGAFAAGTGTTNEIGSGWYKISLTAADTNTNGDLAFHCSAPGADFTDFVDQVWTSVNSEFALTAGTIAAVTTVNGNVVGTVAAVTTVLGNINGTLAALTANNDKTNYTLTTADKNTLATNVWANGSRYLSGTDNLTFAKNTDNFTGTFAALTTLLGNVNGTVAALAVNLDKTNYTLTTADKVGIGTTVRAGTMDAVITITGNVLGTVADVLSVATTLTNADKTSYTLTSADKSTLATTIWTNGSRYLSGTNNLDGINVHVANLDLNEIQALIISGTTPIDVDSDGKVLGRTGIHRA